MTQDDFLQVHHLCGWLVLSSGLQFGGCHEDQEERNVQPRDRILQVTLCVLSSSSPKSKFKNQRTWANTNIKSQITRTSGCQVDSNRSLHVPHPKSYTSWSCSELNLIKIKIPVLGHDIVERRSSLHQYSSSNSLKDAVVSVWLRHAGSDRHLSSAAHPGALWLPSSSLQPRPGSPTLHHDQVFAD